VIVDKSGSMEGARWAEAQKALATLAPQCCAADPDGMTLYFFSHAGTFPRTDHIKNPQIIADAFKKQRPDGGTCLHGVLDHVFREHFERGRAPTTILIITDGSPDNEQAARKVIIDAANAVLNDNELSISFIQIGNDHAATKFLNDLDNHLRGAKFDIVDAVTVHDMQGLSFVEFVHKSLT